MRMTCKQSEFEKEQTDALIVGVDEECGVDLRKNTRLREMCVSFLALKDFSRKLNETAVLYSGETIGPKRVCLVGLGDKKGHLDAVRQAVATATKELLKRRLTRFSVALDSFAISEEATPDVAQAVTEGSLLATYQFDAHKKIPEDERIRVEEICCLFESDVMVDEVASSVAVGERIAAAVKVARDLQNQPGNWLTPSRLAEAAQEIAKGSGLKCEVLDKTAMRTLKMEALLGVAKGSVEPPRFVILEHNGNNPNSDTVVFVGKGITFDSGGISIKPSAKMEEMKFDMSGAAAVVGAMKAVAELDIPLHVVGLIPTAENLPSGNSMKPGDILTASSGKTIEIINTDAEGRLILADALVYAQRFKPKAVVDLATLTGACVVALGRHATGLFGTDDGLLTRLREAGEKAGERLWPMPLWEDYYDEMKSDYADIKNAGERWGGAITAAAFLGNFAEGYPWAHLDIAGTAYTDKERGYFSKGGTGVGVRLLVQFLHDWVNEKSG